MSPWRDMLNLPPQGGEFASRLDILHVIVVGISLVSSLIIFGLAIWWGIRYRRGSGRHDPQSRTPRRVEIGLAFGLMALFLVWWALGWNLVQGSSNQMAADRLDIQVIAKQWMWTFVYPDGRELIDELVLPVDRPIRLHLTSRDVIHSLYIPAFRRKHDALPNRTTQIDLRPRRTGAYRLLCAEYCGLSHSQMTGVVRVLPPSEWAAWQGAAPVGEDLVDRGRRAAIRHGCFACHTVDGQAHIGPSWQGRFGTIVPLADGGSVLVDEPYLTRSMMDPSAEIAAGYRDLMPSYRGRLDAVDSAAIVAYIEAVAAGALDETDRVPAPLPLPDLDGTDQEGAW